MQNHSNENRLKINQKSTKNKSKSTTITIMKIHRKPNKNLIRIVQSPKNGAEHPACGATILLRSRRLNEKFTHFVLGVILNASWIRLGRVLGDKISRSWSPKSKENRLSIHAKIDQKFDAFQVPVFMQFWLKVGTKTEACWHQNRIKNRCQLRKADVAKSIENQLNFH